MVINYMLFYGIVRLHPALEYRTPTNSKRSPAP